MVRPDLQKWSLSLPALTELSVHSPHPRTRERLLALVLVAQGACAWSLRQTLGRNVHTLLKWVHDFNLHGPSALIYRHTGGTPSRCSPLAPLLGEVLEQAAAAAAAPGAKKNLRPC